MQFCPRFLYYTLEFKGQQQQQQQTQEKFVLPFLPYVVSTLILSYLDDADLVNVLIARIFNLYEVPQKIKTRLNRYLTHLCVQFYVRNSPLIVYLCVLPIIIDQKFYFAIDKYRLANFNNHHMFYLFYPFLKYYSFMIMPYAKYASYPEKCKVTMQKLLQKVPNQWCKLNQCWCLDYTYCPAAAQNQLWLKKMRA